jgi:hypothetical protein
MVSTPPWAYRKVRGHRELACVHTVVPNHVAPEHYADFVDGLPQVPHHLGIDAPEAIRALQARRARWPIAVLAYRHENPHRGYPPLADTFAELPAVFPDLAVLEIRRLQDYRELGHLHALIQALRARLPKLTAVRIDGSGWGMGAGAPPDDLDDQLAALEAIDEVAVELTGFSRSPY